MTIDSKQVIVNKSDKELFEFLSDYKNFEHLMPSEVQKFEADENSFVFGIKGMPEVRLLRKEAIEFSKITLKAASSKLPVELSIVISKIDDAQTEAQLFFEGEFNAMMKMMIKKPLTNFLNALIDNIKKL